MVLQVMYVNALARMTGAHEVTYVKRGKEAVTNAARCVASRAHYHSLVPGMVCYSAAMGLLCLWSYYC